MGLLFQEFRNNIFGLATFSPIYGLESTGYPPLISFLFKQLSEIDSVDFAETSFLLGCINLFKIDKFKSRKWYTLLKILETDKISLNRKSLIIEFLELVYKFYLREHKQSQVGLYFKNNVISQINNYDGIIKSVEKKSKALANEYVSGIRVDNFSKEQIEKHFFQSSLSEVHKYFEDSIYLPLFKAAENEMNLFLSKVNNEKNEDTNYARLLNFSHKYFQIILKGEARDEWWRIKRKAYKIVKIRDKAAHAAIQDLDKIDLVKNTIKSLIAFINNQKQTA